MNGGLSSDQAAAENMPEIQKPSAPLARVEAMESRLLLSAALKQAHVPHHSRNVPPLSATRHHKPGGPAASGHQKHAAAAVTTHYATPANIQLGPVADPAADLSPADGGAPAVAPFTPAQIRHFYGLDAVTLNGIVGDGAGQTIGIVDAFNQPGMINSADPTFVSSDLHQFDVKFNLPDPPSFTKVDEYGGTDIPTTYSSGWAIEISLDVEWAHAMAPAAGIVLVECNSSSYGDLLTNGAATAARLSSVVSMSFVGGEFNGDTQYDGVFTAPGVTFLASAGDAGASSTGYPAYSPNVIAVGGTQITTADNLASYGSESVWNDQYGSTGGAISTVTPKPSYQSGVTISDVARVAPDIAFNAAPSTGVYVYDSSLSPAHQLYRVGGTSLSSPCWAGIIAVADQGRSLLGLGTLGGRSQTLPRLYQLASSDFHDITDGYNNGYFAGPGYDACTGLGTPIAQKLIPDLAGGATVTGRVFSDKNANGVFDGIDSPLAGKTVYLDLNNNAQQDTSETTAITNPTGLFSFPDQFGGQTGVVRLAAGLPGYVVVTGNTPYATAYGDTQTANTALFPTTYTDTAGAKSYTLGLNAAGSTVQISINNTIGYSAPVALASSFTFNLTGVGDGLTVDGTNGNPVPAGGINLAAAGGTLNVIGTASGNDAFTVTASSIAFGANPINFSNTGPLVLNPGSGTDSLAVYSGAVSLAAQKPGVGILTRKFSAISIAADARVTILDPTAHADRTLVITSTLASGTNATLDLGGNDMVVHDGSTAALFGLLASGFNNGTWNGTGLISTTAANDPTHRTAVGFSSGTGFAPSAPFDGHIVQPTDVVLKYTYYGDANLDGRVDGSDYTKIDFAYAGTATGWENGDFNYDTYTDGSDYTLIDNAFNTQGPRQ